MFFCSNPKIVQNNWQVYLRTEILLKKPANCETFPNLLLKKNVSHLQDDREVVLAATSSCGSSLVHASQRLRQERAVVLSAVSVGSQIENVIVCCIQGIII